MRGLFLLAVLIAFPSIPQAQARLDVPVTDQPCDQLSRHAVHPECQRIELGVFTVNAPATSGSCGGEFQVPRMKWLAENRRFYIADVERGSVVSSIRASHSAHRRPVTRGDLP